MMRSSPYRPVAGLRPPLFAAAILLFAQSALAQAIVGTIPADFPLTIAVNSVTNRVYLPVAENPGRNRRFVA